MIDVHAHVVLPDIAGRAGVYGPELDTGADGLPRFRVGDFVLHGVDYRGTPFMDVDERLRVNDRLGIALQVLSPNPLTYFHHAPVGLASEFCRWHNESIAEMALAHPTRFRAFAQLPMQSPEEAATELRRSSELGLVGAYIGTDFGIDFDDQRLDAVWDAAVETNLPIFIHPAPGGIDGPIRDPRLRRFDLDLSVGFMYEETVAVCTLIYGGVLDRHPELDLCISHGGGACAYMRGRLDHQGRTRPWARANPVDFGAGLGKLWFDNHLHDDESLEMLERRVGSDRIVLGTNLAGWDAPSDAKEIPHKSLYDDNARRLLRLAPEVGQKSDDSVQA